MKIKEAELRDILEEVSADLAKAFASEKEKLSKAAGDEPEEESIPAEGSESAPPVEASDSAPPAAPEASEAPPAEASPDMSATPDGAPAPDADPAANSAPLTPEALKGEYAKLAPEELDMHIKAALEVKASMAGAPDAPPADASAAPMAPPAAGPAMDAPPAMKAELKASPERAGKDAIEALGKAEAMFQMSRKYEEEIENLKTLAKSSQEDVENLTKILTRVLEQPLRKAVTTVAHLPKAEEKKELSAADVHARLKELAAKPDLKKAERQLINDFYDGRVKADKLAPLFEDHK